MIKKIAYVGAIALLISSMISCEKDYTEVGTSIIDNSKFEKEQKTFDVTVTQEDITSVQADNINTKIGEYLFGIYKPNNYKKVAASFISQLGYRSALRTSQSNTDDKTTYGTTTNIDSTYVLDKVIIKLPYTATKSNGVFVLDSVIGNNNVDMTLKVFRNETYLNTLNPETPTESNTFQSNYNYTKGDNLTENNQLNFQLNATDTAYVFNRTKILNNVAEQFKDTIKIKSSTSKSADKPFLAIPLDLAKMKTLFWDKFGSTEFSSAEDFQNYFKGLILQVEGEDGALIPLNFEKNLGTPTLDFYYTITRIEDGSFKDTVNGTYSFSLSGVRNSIYEMSTSPNNTANTFKIQGTAGSMAKIDILTDAQIEEIRTAERLINDAVLTFNVNQSIDKNQYLVPQRLLLFTKRDGKEVQLSDAYTETEFYGGTLTTSDSNLPEKYTFRITNHLINIINGEVENTPLYLKVYNYNTDIAKVSNGQTTVIRPNVQTYNWNPRGVTLYDGSSANGDSKVQLKITYSKEK